MACDCGSCVNCESLYSLPLGQNGADGADGRGYNASSSSNLTALDVEPATVTLVIDINKAYSTGARVRVSELNAPIVNFFEGIVFSYNPATGAMVITTDLFRGAGVYAAWNVNLSGEKAASGMIFSDITPVTHSGTITVEEDFKNAFFSPGLFSVDGDMMIIRVDAQIPYATEENTIRIKFGNPSGTLSTIASFTDYFPGGFGNSIEHVSFEIKVWRQSQIVCRFSVTGIATDATGNRETFMGGADAKMIMNPNRLFSAPLDFDVDSINVKVTGIFETGTAANFKCNILSVEFVKMI